MGMKHNGKIKYIINQEKRSVIAFKTGISDDLINKFYKSSSNSPNIDLEKYLIIPNKIYAEAKCHPDDTWDAEIGKQVARERLGRMYRKLIRTACVKYISKINNHINFVFDLKEKYKER